MRNRIQTSPIWLAAFRPFFLLTLFTGFAFPLIWGLVFSGVISFLPKVSALQWHAHEMLFGFAGALLYGFLLTASKNWVQVRGIHGWGLIVLVFFWGLDRISPFVSAFGGGDNLSLLKFFLGEGFVVLAGFYIIKTLIQNRAKDSYSDNAVFIGILLGMMISKGLFLSPTTRDLGLTLTMGLFRVAFVMMMERTMTQFMKATESVVLVRHPLLDFSIRATVILCVGADFLPAPVHAILFGVTAILLFVRWVLWNPMRGFRRFGNATMYVGYLGLVLHFLLKSWNDSGFKIGITIPGAFALHIFTFLCLGIIAPSMIVRISQGHTGRRPEFHRWDQVAISMIGVAALFRLILPVWEMPHYSTWILISSLLWSSAYLILLIRFSRFLVTPRVDGKIH